VEILSSQDHPRSASGKQAAIAEQQYFVTNLASTLYVMQARNDPPGALLCLSAQLAKYKVARGRIEVSRWFIEKQEAPAATKLGYTLGYENAAPFASREAGTLTR
jgi:hypothetical protein